MSKLFREFKLGYAVGILIRRYDSSNSEAPNECLNASIFYEIEKPTKGNLFNVYKWMGGVDELIKTESKRAWESVRTTPIEELTKWVVPKLLKRLDKLCDPLYYNDIPNGVFEIMSDHYMTWIRVIEHH